MTTDVNNDGRWRMALWGGAVALWLTPLAAMQVMKEMRWDGFDFAVFGAMLISVCGVCELAMRLSRDLSYRIGFALAAGAAFFLVWINLAVGIIGSEDNPANLMYAGVLAIGGIGAILARFKPRGMAVTLMVMAAAQGLVSITALATGHFTLVIDGFFIVLWLASARCFHKAGKAATSQSDVRKSV